MNLREASPLDALVMSDAELRAYRSGQAAERWRHQCPREVSVHSVYPKTLMSRVDDLADAAFPELGIGAYRVAEGVHEWFSDPMGKLTETHEFDDTDTTTEDR